MNLLETIKRKQYISEMKRSGLSFSQESDMPVWPAAGKGAGRHAVRIGGAVRDEIKKYIAENGFWIEAEKSGKKGCPDFFLYDSSFFDGEGFPQQLMTMKNIPVVAWIHQEELSPAALAFVKSADYVVTSGESAKTTMDKAGIQPNCELPEYIDFKADNPIGRGSSDMWAAVGIALPVSGNIFEVSPELEKLLVHWAKRRDLALWRPKTCNLPMVVRHNYELFQSLQGTFEDISEVDAESKVQVILNFSGKKLLWSQRLARAARGQLFLDVEERDHSLYVSDGRGGIDCSLEDWLWEMLHNHGRLLKLRTQLIRATFVDHSLPRQLNTICEAVLGKAFYDPSVSVLVSTNRPENFEIILGNFRRQKVERKELVVIFHCDYSHNRPDLNKLEAMVREGEPIRLFSLDSRYISFGYALSYGVAKTDTDYVAKFDDDDYYAANFLTDLFAAAYYSGAGVCGRLSFHTFLEESRLLVCRKPGNEYRFCFFVPGATLLIKSTVFQKVMFSDVPRNIDGKFCSACVEKGIKIFSADTFSLLVLRAQDKDKHTWKASDMLIYNQSLPTYPEIDAMIESGAAYQMPPPKDTYENAVNWVCV